EDGIRDRTVTGVQTCALPISHGQPPVGRPAVPRAGAPRLAALATARARQRVCAGGSAHRTRPAVCRRHPQAMSKVSEETVCKARSEERRVGKEWRWESGREEE